MDFGSLQSYLVIVSCLIQPLVRVWVVDLVPEAVGQIVSCSYDGLQGISKVFSFQACILSHLCFLLFCQVGLLFKWHLTQKIIDCNL